MIFAIPVLRNEDAGYIPGILRGYSDHRKIGYNYSHSLSAYCIERKRYLIWAACNARQHVGIIFVYLGVTAVARRSSPVAIDIDSVAGQFHGLEW